MRKMCVVCEKPILETGTSITHGPCHIECYHRYLTDLDTPNYLKEIKFNDQYEERTEVRRQFRARRRLVRIIGVIVILFLAWMFWAVCQIVIGTDRTFTNDPELFNYTWEHSQENK